MNKALAIYYYPSKKYIKTNRGRGFMLQILALREYIQNLSRKETLYNPHA